MLGWTYSIVWVNRILVKFTQTTYSLSELSITHSYPSYWVNLSIQNKIFVSLKIGQDLKECETKPQLVDQQCVVYHFKCNLCDTGSYVGYTGGHLYARVDGHKSTSSSVRKHMATTTRVLTLRTSLAVSKFSRNTWTNSIVLSTRCFTSNN